MCDFLNRRKGHFISIFLIDTMLIFSGCTQGNEYGKDIPSEVDSFLNSTSSVEDMCEISEEVPEIQEIIGDYKTTYEMIEDRSLQSGMIVTTEGYYTSLDGGDAEYIIVENDTNTKLPIISLKNGLKALLLCEDNSANIKQFGAYGDGVHDDMEAINAALNSGLNSIVFTPGDYRITDLIQMVTPNINIVGNGATIFTDNEYRKDTFFYSWAFCVFADNIAIDNLKMEARETLAVGYKTQFCIKDCSNVKVTNCSFLVPDTVYSGYNNMSKEDYYGIEIGNVDVYGGWKDITFDNCSFTVLSGTGHGDCIQIRDIACTGGENMIFTNNKCISNACDEIIACFSNRAGLSNTNTISNVIIKGNEIKALPCEYGNQRVVGIALGYNNNQGITGLEFKDNSFDAYMNYVMIQLGDSKNVQIERNEINFHGVDSSASARIFIGNDDDHNIEVKDNIIVVHDEGLGSFAGIGRGWINYKSNRFLCDVPVFETAFYTNSIVENNILMFNQYIKSLGCNILQFSNNQVTCNSETSRFFEFYGNVWENDVSIQENFFYYKYEGKEGVFLLLNGCNLNGRYLKIEENTLQNDTSDNIQRELYYSNIDDITGVTWKDNKLATFDYIDTID